MASSTRAGDGPLAGTVELLDGTDAPRTAGHRHGRAPALALLGAAALIAVAVLGRSPSPVAGELRVLDVHFGQPFELDWLALEPTGTVLLDGDQPLPMTSSAACVGFGRPDWPPERRQPSVAHCADADEIADLGAGTVGLLRVVPVGDTTWYLLRFGRPVADGSVMVDPAPGFAPGVAGLPPLYVGDRDAAALLPTGTPSFELRWREAGGRSYHCAVDLTPPVAERCG